MQKTALAIEYHHDTNRGEVHYYYMVQVDPVSFSRREFKVKCYTVCKTSSCHGKSSTYYYSKVRDAACYGVGSGEETDAKNDSACYSHCGEYNNCDTY